MLRTLVELSLRFRGAVIALACALLGYGIFAVAHTSIDVLPDFAPPQVVVQTESPGLSAEQVEALVTSRIEQALAGTGDLDAIRSQSIQGLSIVTAVFKEGTDVYRARQLLGEQIAQIESELPDGVASPKMTPLTSATMDLLKFGLLSEQLSPMELRTFADWTVAPRLRAVSGVSSVTAFGGEVRQIQVQIEPQRLAAAHVSIEELLDATRRATAVLGAGFVETPGQRIVIETHGQALTPEALADSLVAWRDGSPLRIRDVAHVVVGAAPQFGDCLIQGRPGVLVKILAQYGANTLDATHAVEAAMKEMEPTLRAAGIDVVPALHRPANFIETAVHNLGNSLLIGALLVSVVLFLFLLDVRAAIISMTAIPLSLLAAVIVLQRLGFTLNTMTLGGLAIAIGEVVDDAIIDVENILRRLRERFGRGEPFHPLTVVREASLEVRGTVVFATSSVVLVFLPVLTMSGLQGRFFRPLGLAYICAVLASLVVALTLTPALSLVMLAGSSARRRPPRPTEWLRHTYVSILRRVIGHPWLAIVLALLLCGMAGTALPMLGGEFLPEFREGHFVLQVSLAPGCSLAELKRVGLRISEQLLANPHIATIEQQIGRTALSEDPWGPHRSEFHIELARLAPEVEAGVGDEIRAALARLPGIQFELLTFLGDRIGETISGETAEVVIGVYGEDLDLLDRKAEEIAAVLASVPAAADMQRGALPGQPSVEVELDRTRLVQLGFQPTSVLEAVQAAYQGCTVGQMYDGARVFDVVALLADEARDDPERVGDLLIQGSSGVVAPLRALADVHLGTGRYLLQREGGRRRQTVTCNVVGRDVASFVAEAKRRVEAAVQLPAGNYLVWSGAAEQQRAARNELLRNGAVALLGIVLLLTLAFRRARNLLLVLANLPFAFVGGVLAAFSSGGTLTMGSWVGFITLFGVTMRYSIMMISHYEHLVAVEGMTFDKATALRGASERLLPILMTAIVTALGLLPIALGSGSAGREIEGPMAIVILGGLATSTLLNLLILPTLALRFGRFGDARAGVSA